MLEHGGKLIQAARDYGIPVCDWLDLSTGLNPHPWPVKLVPLDAWSHLPDDDDGLALAASKYYKGEHVLPVAGSQAAIQILPQLSDAKSRVAILEPAYAEHAHAWRAHGFNVTPLNTKDIDKAIDVHDVILLVNPNNPTGETFSVEQCIRWHKKLADKGGRLIIDEAFIDCTPECSLVPFAHQEGLVILRSLGKFFGLAGARVGFVFAEQNLLTQLAERLGPWPISGPSRCIAKLALSDTQWQLSTREQLMQQSLRLQTLLNRHHLTPSGSSSLFQWLKTNNAKQVHQFLAQQGILTRLFEQPMSIRFGLPAVEPQWMRLELALKSLNKEANITNTVSTCDAVQ